MSGALKILKTMKKQGAFLIPGFGQFNCLHHRYVNIKFNLSEVFPCAQQFSKWVYSNHQGKRIDVVEKLDGVFELLVFSEKFDIEENVQRGHLQFKKWMAVVREVKLFVVDLR